MNKEKKTGLYIHIPFCVSKCYYCDFASSPKSESVIDSYMDSLVNDIEISAIGKKIDTIFIGGGTPSILNINQIKKLENVILKLDTSKDLEFTIEANPGTIKRELVQQYKEMGINRISLGLQSTNNDILKRIGRVHTFEDFLESVNILKENSFNNINVDLIFGLPMSNIEEYKRGLLKVLNVKPTHISSYSLIVEEGTRFYEDRKNGILDLPSEEIEREMYEITKEILNENGYNQYEISNYSLDGYECKHNLIYWDYDEYIGTGLASSGFEHNIRYKKEEDLEKYIKSYKNCEENIIEKHENTLEDNIEEYIMVGLRKTNGINIEDFKERFEMNIMDIYGDIINKYLNINILKREKSNIKLEQRGIEISNIVLADFLGPNIKKITK